MYQHSQTSVWICLAISLAILSVVAAGWLHVRAAQQEGMIMPDRQDVLLRLSGLAFLFLIILGMFYRLQVEVDGREIRLNFGWGIIHRRIPLDGVAAVRIVNNKWWYGWGIRLTPAGWMWNIRGLQAVELEYKNGKRFRIGTDEPEDLAGAINHRISNR